MKMTASSIRLVTALVTALGAWVAAAPALAVPKYVAIPIGAVRDRAAAINVAGDVAGWTSSINLLDTRAFTRSGGVTTDLGTLGGANSIGTGINAWGHVTGTSAPPAGVPGGAFVYANGVLKNLGTLGGSSSLASAINDNGEVTGSANLAGDTAQHAFLYSAGTMVDLGELDFGGSTGYGINNAKQVAGASFLGGTGPTKRAFLYSAGTMIDLAAFGSVFSAGYGINASGHVTGITDTPASGYRAFVHANGVMTTLGTLGGAFSQGKAINASGQVVGNSEAINNGPSRAFLYSGGTMHDLTSLVVTGLAGEVLEDAVAINDSGQIIAATCSIYGCKSFRLDPSMPMTGTVIANPYGAMSVDGGILSGSTITDLQPIAAIQLGSLPISGGQVRIDIDGLSIGAGNTLTIRSGAPGQRVILTSTSATPSAIAGMLIAEGGNGAPPPIIVLRNPNGIAINAGGGVIAPSGLTVDTLGNTWTTGQRLRNLGLLDGGSSLQLLSAGIHGGGTFKGNAIHVSTFGNANNPVSGAHYLGNALKLAPSTGNDVALSLNGYGSSPQVLNLNVAGNVVVSMPSMWPSGLNWPPNNVPVPGGGNRPAGAPDPAYGGGSLLLQVAGSLALNGGDINNFVFPGGIAFKTGGSLDFAGVSVSNGWTTNGVPFQGAFFESPFIYDSVSNIRVFTNRLNWVNFSTLPHAPVRAFELVRAFDASAGYQTADLVAPHLNTYSILVEAAANGQCWLCLINPLPVNMY